MSDDVTLKAQEMGWVPQEEWKGDPEKWRPAADFVDRGENILPILKDRVNKLEADLKIALKSNQKEIDRIKAESYAKAKAEYDEKINHLNELEANAIKNSDGDAYLQIKKVKETVKPPEVEVSGESEEFKNWKDKNPWYQEDKELAEYADFLSHKIVMEKNGHVPDITEALAEMEKRTKAKFPEKFKNARRDDPGAVESGSLATEHTTKRFVDLPADAKNQYKRLAEKFKAQGREFTKESYAQAYFE
jgi:hypothetical protein